MSRGGARPGAGRKKGSKNKRSSIEAAKAIAKGDSPLDIGLAAMAALFEAGDYKAAGDLAAKFAPFIHPRFSPDSEHRLAPHPEQQKQLSLFEAPPAATAPLGKKEAAAAAAANAAEGTGWGDLLETDRAN